MCWNHNKHLTVILSAAKNLAVLLTPKIVKFLTKSSDQRERIEDNRAVARIGWRPCRPVPNARSFASLRMTISLRMTLVLIALAFLTGCGSGHFPVTGEVTLDDKPVEQGTISFEPTDRQGPTTGGKIVGGKYQLEGDAAPLPGKKNRAYFRSSQNRPKDSCRIIREERRDGRGNRAIYPRHLQQENNLVLRDRPARDEPIRLPSEIQMMVKGGLGLLKRFIF